MVCIRTVTDIRAATNATTTTINNHNNNNKVRLIKEFQQWTCSKTNFLFLQAMLSKWRSAYKPWKVNVVMLRDFVFLWRYVRVREAAIDIFKAEWMKVAIVMLSFFSPSLALSLSFSLLPKPCSLLSLLSSISTSVVTSGCWHINWHDILKKIG